MPVRRKRLYMYRTTHGRRADARTVIIIVALALATLAAALLIISLGGGRQGSRGGNAADQNVPAGILRRHH